MALLSPSATVVVAILAAAFVTAMAAAMWKVYHSRGRTTQGQLEEGMIASAGQEQQAYMRDVRMRNQLNAWGVAPAYEGQYIPPRSQVGRPSSRGGDTTTSFGML